MTRLFTTTTIAMAVCSLCHPLAHSLLAFRSLQTPPRSPLPPTCQRQFLFGSLRSLPQRRKLPSPNPTCSITTRAFTTDIASITCDSATQLEDGFSDFVLNGTKMTSVAHLLWRHIVKAGDVVIDATCGNGHDTLFLARLVSGEFQQGFVYGLDVQQSALENTSSLLDCELTPFQRDHVKLLQMCHSKLDQAVELGHSIRMVAFNLGYLPGGDKSFITRTKTTVQALNAAVKVVKPGGLISIMAYIGHPGGREEYEAVRDFAANLPTNDWVCSQHEWLNRPLGPRLMFFSRKE